MTPFTPTPSRQLVIDAWLASVLKTDSRLRGVSAEAAAALLDRLSDVESSGALDAVCEIYGEKSAAATSAAHEEMLKKQRSKTKWL